MVASDINFCIFKSPDIVPFKLSLKAFVGSRHGILFYLREGRPSQDSPWGSPMQAKMAPRARPHTPIVPPSPPIWATTFGAHPLGPTHHTSPSSPSPPFRTTSRQVHPYSAQVVSIRQLSRSAWACHSREGVLQPQGHHPPPAPF